MEFNLSSICDILGDRIEEYKTTSKKRRIERGSCGPKVKIAKFSQDYQTENFMEKNGTHKMYVSTPIETPKTESQQFSALSIFSSVNKLPSKTARSVNQNLNIQGRKLTFIEDDADGVENSNDSPVSIFSVMKPSLETLKRRRFHRATLNVKRLCFDEEDQKNDECLSKHSASESLTKVLTPYYTPKRNRQPRKCMHVRRLSFKTF